eukprot:CFRG1247T1
MEVYTPHTLLHTTFLKTSECQICKKKVRFGQAGFRCKACKSDVHDKCKIAANTQPCWVVDHHHDLVSYTVDTPMSCCGRCTILMKASYSGLECKSCGIVCHLSCSKTLIEVCSDRRHEKPADPDRKEMSFFAFMSDGPRSSSSSIGSTSSVPKRPVNPPKITKSSLIESSNQAEAIKPRGFAPKANRPKGAILENTRLSENRSSSEGPHPPSLSTRSYSGNLDDGNKLQNENMYSTNENDEVSVASKGKQEVSRVWSQSHCITEKPQVKHRPAQDSKNLDSRDEPPIPRPPKLNNSTKETSSSNTLSPVAKPPNRMHSSIDSDTTVRNIYGNQNDENDLENVMEQVTLKSSSYSDNGLPIDSGDMVSPSSRHSHVLDTRSAMATSSPVNAYNWNTDLAPIVLDNGSGRVKAGFASEEFPSCVFPAIVGRVKHRRHLQTDIIANIKDKYVGTNAQTKRGILALSYPIEHGVITSWDDMQLIWETTFMDELRTDPAERPVMLTEAPYNPVANKHTMAQIMFETFQVPATFIAIQAVLSMYSTGRLTGLVVDAGDGVTHACPMYRGYLLPHSVLRMNLAGRDLTDYMMQLLTERGYFFTSTAEREIVRDIKEKCCYVAYDYDEEIELDRLSNSVEEYTLPDGQVISVGAECFRCPEALFHPEMLGLEMQGLHGLAYSSIFRSDVNIRKELFNNVTLSGGTTMILGLSSRLEKELVSLAPKASAVQVTSTPNQEYSVWQGGAALSSLSSFLPQWVTREEYEEYGDTIVDTKSSLMR